MTAGSNEVIVARPSTEEREKTERMETSGDEGGKGHSRGGERWR